MLPASFLLLMALLSLHSTSSSATKPLFPAAFFFGDSTLDTGNNRYIQTFASGHHPPYGRGFPSRVATGRFSDGLLVPDFLCASLGIKQFSPPSMDPTLTDSDVLTGVNFAVAGSGFDEMTTRVIMTISMAKQVEMFKSYMERLERAAKGKEEAAMIVKESLYLVSSGSNDLIFSFYDLMTRRNMTMDQYQSFLLQQVKQFYKGVYDLGARKFIVSGFPPIGCLPLQITAKLSPPLTRPCISGENIAAQQFNSKLKNLLPTLQASLNGTRFIYMDLYGAFMSILKNPRKYGFKHTKRGCCGTGIFEVGPFCNVLSPFCKNIDSFVFFDAVHPTQRVYKMIADNMMNNSVPLLL